jgi:hypothetical protein
MAHPNIRAIKIGQRFGRLTVQARAGNERGGGALWACLCDCGETTVVIAHNLGYTKSCGCWRRDHMRSVASKSRNRHLNTLDKHDGDIV